ncbi:MAG TPA: hypothetical protein VH062_34065 [Polyangiaceae bacterium]|nr:hypothetical protein [Polyangiaceae bacterium]
MASLGVCWAAGLFVADEVYARPAQVTVSDRIAKPDETQMRPDPVTTREIKEGAAPFILQLTFVDAAMPVAMNAPGFHCTGLGLVAADKVSVITAAHCLAGNNFSLIPGRAKLPATLLLSDGTRSVPFSLSEGMLTFDKSLTSQFTSAHPFVWESAKSHDVNVAALFFPGGIGECSAWPTDVVRIQLDAQDVQKHWALTQFPAANRLTAVSAQPAQSLRVFGGGCTVADSAVCATTAAVYKRYDDSSFAVERQLTCGRLLAKSSSTAVVMPGDSGGPVLLASGSGAKLSEFAGVISGVSDSGELVVAPAPTTLLQ